jgi:hypothetical protein
MLHHRGHRGHGERAGRMVDADFTGGVGWFRFRIERGSFRQEVTEVTKLLQRLGSHTLAR